MPPREIQELTERMFDAVNVPKSARQEYIIPLIIIIIGSEANGKDKAVAQTNKHLTALSYL